MQSVANGQLGGDLGDGKPRRLAGEGRAARHARIHLNDEGAAGHGVNGKLDVGAPGLNPDALHHPASHVSEQLVFLVGEGLCGSYGDAVARVDAHRIQVLDGTDDHKAVIGIAHHLEFELFPADDRLFDQDLGYGALLHAPADHGVKVLPVVGDSTTGAPESKRGSDDRWKAHIL